MKNIIHHTSIVVVLLLSLISKGQVIVTTQSLNNTNNGQSAVSVPNCGNIDLGLSTSSTINLGILLTKPVNQVVGQSELFVYTKKSSSDPRINRSFQSLSDTFFLNGQTTSTYFTSVTFNINSNDFNPTGGTLFVVFKSSGGIEYFSCNYTISRSLAPTFSLSPSNVSLVCGTASPRTFTVNSANIPAGATLSYNWTAPGWTGSSTTNTITLTPNSTSVLPGNVTVRPVLNGVLQNQLSCSVTRASFVSTATISGPTEICTGSANYTLTGLSPRQYVAWSLSNPNIATLSNIGNSSVTVSFNGNGAQTLSAEIVNACGQITVKNFLINSGSSTFNSSAIISGDSSTICSGSRVFTISNIAVGQNVTWSVSDENIATLSSSSNSQTTVNFTGNGGQLTIYATITNSCGQSAVKSFTLYSGTPVLTSLICDSMGKDFCSQGPIELTSSSIPSLDFNDKVTVTFSGMTTSEANLNSNWEWRTINNKINLSGIRNSRTIGLLTFGQTGFEVKAKNACGWSDWYPVYFELVEIPDPIQRLRKIADDISVFPNPTNDKWNFMMPGLSFETIEILDITGKVIVTENVTSENVLIDGSNLTSGIYIAKLKAKSRVETIKLVKN